MIPIRKVRKIIAYVIAFLMAVSSLYVIPPDVAEAATIVMEDGEFFYATTVKKATSSIRYRTIGWQLHSKPGCPRQPPSVTDECDPRATNGPLSIDWTHRIEKITQLYRTYVRIEWV